MNNRAINVTRRQLLKAFFIILVLFLIVWGVSVFVVPRLPPPFNNWITVAGLSVVGVFGAIGGINNLEQLLLRRLRPQVRQPRPSTPIILFVDNDRDFRATWTTYLMHDNYHVIQAADAAEARRRIEAGGIDLVLLDVRLMDEDDNSDTSGLRLAKELAERKSLLPEDAQRQMRFPPVIILTAHESVEGAREALEPMTGGLPPAVGFAIKREGPAVLLAKIRKTLS